MDPNERTQDIPAVTPSPPSGGLAPYRDQSHWGKLMYGLKYLAWLMVGVLLVVALLTLLVQYGYGLLAYVLCVLVIALGAFWLVIRRDDSPVSPDQINKPVAHQWVGNAAARTVKSYFRPKDTVLLITRRHQIVWLAPAAAILAIALPLLSMLLWAATTPVAKQPAKRRQDFDPGSLLPSHDVDLALILGVLAVTVVLLFAVWVNWSTYYFAVSDGILLLGRIYPAPLHWLPGKVNTVATRTVNSANIDQSVVEKVVNAARLETDTPSAGDRAFNLIRWMPRPKEILLIFLDAVDMSRKPKAA